MSFVILLQHTPNGEFLPFKRALLAEILGPHAEVGSDGDIWGARFSDRDFGEITGAENEEITTLGFGGGGEKFMQMIWEIADRTRSYIFWPEPEPRPNLLVTSAEALAEIPQSVVESMGPAKIVHDGGELADYIFGPAD